jgi:hypothetical protein
MGNEAMQILQRSGSWLGKRWKKVIGPFRSLLRAENGRRLRAELSCARAETNRLIHLTNGADKPWAKAAIALHECAEKNLDNGRVDAGWRAHHGALRMNLQGIAELCHSPGLAAYAQAVRDEGRHKLRTWRKETVEALLSPSEAFKYPDDELVDLVRLELCTKLLHEHYASIYHGVEGLRRQIAWLLAAGVSALSLWLFAVDWASVLDPTTTAKQHALLHSVILFGALGGVVSGIFSIAKKSPREMIPDQLVSTWFTLSRPVVGGMVAVVIYLALKSEALSLVGNQSEYFTLVIAFVSGFSERLLQRTVEAASGGSSS